MFVAIRCQVGMVTRCILRVIVLVRSRLSCPAGKRCWHRKFRFDKCLCRTSIPAPGLARGASRLTTTSLGNPLAGVQDLPRRLWNGKGPLSTCSQSWFPGGSASLLDQSQDCAAVCAMRPLHLAKVMQHAPNGSSRKDCSQF